jgi:hypothetical protein
MWTIPGIQHDDHINAMHVMKQKGPAVKNSSNIFIMCLKQYYAHLFVQEMETQLTAKAVLCGFRPLFLIKNCLLQRTSFGVNNYQFSSMDVQPKTYLRLIAYFKGTVENNDLCIIPITNSKDQLLNLQNDE